MSRKILLSNYLGLLSAMSVISSSGGYVQPANEFIPPFLPKKKKKAGTLTVNGKLPPRPIPKGCKEYFFNYLGDFINHNDGVYAFRCIALNDKSAIKKFEKWVNSDQNDERSVATGVQ